MPRIRDLLPLVVVIAVVAAFGGPAAAEEGDKAALAKAMQEAKVTLGDGLSASEREGKPISAKFEIEDGKLQLSVYTLKGDAPTEVVLDPASAAVRKTEKITDSDDLKEAASQTAAMAKASRTLLAATADAVKANPGSRAISAMPRLDGGHALADVMLLQGAAFKTVAEKID